MINNIYKNSALLIAVTVIVLAVGCSPTEIENGNPLSNPNIDATFTTTADASGNHITTSGQTDGILVHRWDNGDGEFKGNSNHEFFFPDAGTYTITHTVYGNGGSFNKSMNEIIITKPDPISGNLILGGNFLNQQDYAHWIKIDDDSAVWTFNQGSATLPLYGWIDPQAIIYQAIEVVAGKKYKIDMHIKGEVPGWAWLDVFVEPVKPVQDVNYGGNGIKPKLGFENYGDTFQVDGLLSKIYKKGDATGAVMTFAQSGTQYLVIKGNGNIGPLTITNIELRRVE